MSFNEGFKTANSSLKQNWSYSIMWITANNKYNAFAPHPKMSYNKF